ncbi:MAG: Bacteriophage repressor helix-turn-helix domain [Actinomycetota bacterium]|nr:Bacteriophage repressor helix-turn-helix domain [Actinomycetota bacterium]
MSSDTSGTMNERIPELTLGWRLKMALGHMTGQDMADALEVSRTSVSRWMSGRGTPPKSVYVKQWALITGTDMRWLLTGQQEAPHPMVLDEGLAAECAVRESNPQPAD